MTICIAAIGKDNGEEIIVAATDHMVTMGTLGQFEHTISKYKELNRNTIAMLAGIPLLFDDLIKLSGSSMGYTEIKHQIKKNLKDKRNEIFKDHVLDLYGLDENWLTDAVKAPFPNQLTEEIMKKILNFKLNTTILLAGFDQNNAILSEISETTFADFRDMNFHAIGSGNIQAVNTLMFQKHDKNDSLLTTVYDVYKAKKNAEVARGVGRETELVILTKDSGCKLLKKESYNIMKDIYEKEVKLGRNHKFLASLRFDEGDG
jgi:hypothetical protein